MALEVGTVAAGEVEAEVVGETEAVGEAEAEVETVGEAAMAQVQAQEQVLLEFQHQFNPELTPLAPRTQC